MIQIEQIDYSFSKIVCLTESEEEVRLKVFHNFSYFVDGYKFMPLYKMGRWNGKTTLFDYLQNKLPNGLVDQTLKYIESLEIESEYIPNNDLYIKDTDDLTIDEAFLDKFCKEINLPFEPRDYQKKLVIQAINTKRMIGVSATSSGKSLAIYLIIRIMLHYDKRCFLIVPNVSLVLQMYSDFQEYGLSDEDSQELIHLIYGGQEKVFTKKVLIGTWQSLYKPEVLCKFTTDINETELQYDCIILDECHLVKSGDDKKVSEILNAFTSSPWKIGVTGSLPKHELTKQQVIASMGEPVHIIKAQELVERGLATQLDVNIVFLEYPDEDRKYIKKIKSWPKESVYFNEHVRKKNFIVRLCESRMKKEDNILLFFKRVAYGKELYKLLKELHPNVYYVDGGVKAEKREIIRNTVNESYGNIIVASYGVFSTGLNLPSINTGIFAENPGKSDVTLIQSLGRFLRQCKGKEIARIYDIVDNCSIKSYKNYCFKHFLERVEVYRDEGWFLNEKYFKL